MLQMREVCCIIVKSGGRHCLASRTNRILTGGAPTALDRARTNQPHCQSAYVSALLRALLLFELQGRTLEPNTGDPEWLSFAIPEKRE